MCQEPGVELSRWRLILLLVLSVDTARTNDGLLGGTRYKRVKNKMSTVCRRD